LNIVFISDFFVSQVLGGGEFNDSQLIEMLESVALVKKINSQHVTLDFLKSRKDNRFIISNFIILSSEIKKYILDNLDYIIYEHDHKYLLSRNPSLYENYKAPKKEIVNLDFYKNAKKVFCQSSFHKNIAEKNLCLNNIVSVGGNLWSLEVLEYLRLLSKKEKKDVFSIMDSPIPHKNTKKAIAFCKYKNYDYELVKSKNYKEFLDRLSNNKKLAFFPETPETLSRVVVEARMAGMETVTSKNIGAIGEEWFSLKGPDLIEIMILKREQIKQKVLNNLS
jgi:hypothetical protein